MNDGLHDYDNFLPFVEEYKGRSALFTYLSGGLVQVDLLDESDSTVVDDDEIREVMGQEAYSEVRCGPEKSVVLEPRRA